MKAWVVTDAPPDRVLERAEAESWPEGTIEQWRRNLEQVLVRTVYPILLDDRLVTIDVSGLFLPLNWSHPTPLADALREGVTKLRPEQGKRPLRPE